MNADSEKIDRILVRAVNWVGDTILTYPAVQRLKTRFPRSHLAILFRNNLVDTGTMHVAGAVGTPVAAIFGSTDSITTGPWGKGHTVVRKEASCSPCLKRICPTDHHCMKNITVDEAEEIIDHRFSELVKK